jgi:hypothetical protein
MSLFLLCISLYQERYDTKYVTGDFKKQRKSAAGSNYDKKTTCLLDWTTELFDRQKFLFRTSIIADLKSLRE